MLEALEFIIGWRRKHSDTDGADRIWKTRNKQERNLKQVKVIRGQVYEKNAFLYTLNH